MVEFGYDNLMYLLVEFNDLQDVCSNIKFQENDLLHKYSIVAKGSCSTLSV